MTDHKAIFDAVESTLIRVGSQRVPEAIIRSRLDEFKLVETRSFTDAEYFDIMVDVVFYSGFRADTVNKKKATIRRHFPDYGTVAQYREARIGDILGDPRMIRHEGKIRACVSNAQRVDSLVDQYGSFQSYIESFQPEVSVANVMRFRQDLMSRFGYLAKVSSYHFLTEIGAPVLKPDRVVRRIFYRLGLIHSEEDKERDLRETVAQGREFAEATGHPIRYIDIVFVAYGRSGLTRTGDIGSRRAICSEDDPMCGICGANRYCRYHAQQT